MLGKRIGFRQGGPCFPSSIALTALGAALLWFGWFGFNAGSALVADGLGRLGPSWWTNTSASRRRLAWMFIEWMINKKPTVLGNRLGRCGRGPWSPSLRRPDLFGLGSSILIGLAAGAWGSFSVARLKQKIGNDDSLDRPSGLHAMCGTLGALRHGAARRSGRETPPAPGFSSATPSSLLIQLVSIPGHGSVYGHRNLVLIYATKALTGGLRVGRGK